MVDDALSNALGWVSIACWIIVYTPQIIENYQLKSGEGLSVLFVVVWLLGDLCNIIGAGLAGLQVTVIILAAYYTLCDIVLLVQIFYYRRTHPVRLRSTPAPAVVVSDEAGESVPLLAEQRTSSSSHPEKTRSISCKSALLYSCAITFVVATGIAAWVISKREKLSDEPPVSTSPKDVIEWHSQVLGWASALLYLGSRIPQILKNFKTKCEGLSLALFLFAIAGNVTYVLSICTDSMEKRHLIANASWIAGSGLTVGLDIFVLCQFFYYRRAEHVFVSEGAGREG